MTTAYMQDFVNEIAKRYHGLVVITGPVGSGKTSAVERLESEVSSQRRGRYFRVGMNEPSPESGLMFVNNFLPSDLSAEEKVQFERGIQHHAARWDPAGVFIDDIDKLDVDMCNVALNMAMTGTVVVVSIEADTAEQAVKYLADKTGSAIGPNSILAVALAKVAVCKGFNSPIGTHVTIDVAELDEEFYQRVADMK